MSHKEILSNQFQAISKKKSHSHFNVYIFFSVDIMTMLKSYLCATKVVLWQALQLVASKLPLKDASCDKVLKAGSYSLQLGARSRQFEIG